MNSMNEKERNSKITKMIQYLESLGVKKKSVNRLDDYLKRDDCHKKKQTEEDYHKEQAEWLRAVKKKSKNKEQVNK